MPLSYSDLAVRGRDGRRVAVVDCKLEPLNLLIPGNAPIVVPKKYAWRSPFQQAKMSNRNSYTLNVDIAQDDYEGDLEENEDEDENKDENKSLDHDDVIDTQPLLKKTLVREKATGRCRKDSIVKDNAKEAKHRRKTERHQKKAEIAREEAAGERDRLQRRIAKQEAYIVKLKARYEGAEAAAAAKRDPSHRSKSSAKRNEASSTLDSTTVEVSDADDGATTDGSVAVREMLANMKIRAGGRENPRFFAQPGDLPWSVSDDSQLIALKNGSDSSYAVIGECMGRRAGEVKRRFKYLKDCDFKIPGEDETTGAEKTGEEEVTTDAEKNGEETTDVEQAGAETTDAEKTDDEKKNDGVEATDADKSHDQTNGGGDWTEAADTQLWRLKSDGKSWADIHAIMGGSKSGTKDRYKHLQSIDFKVPEETAAAEDTACETADAAKQTEAAAQSPEPRTRSATCKSTTAHKASAAEPMPDHPRAHLDAGSRYDGSACDAGTNVYIAQYARSLLAEANAGRTRIPEPDDIFDEEDCILLALADSRHLQNRWLEIQADYFNVTGRMVPQEVLKWKLDGASTPEDPDHDDGGKNC